MRRVAAAALALLASCDGGSTPPPVDGGSTHPDFGPLLTEAPVDSKVAYEGYQRFVTTITVEGHDMTGAHIVPLDPHGPIEVVEQVCNPVRCALHLRIHDTVSEVTVPDPVPAPIALVNQFLNVTTTDGTMLRATIGVFPAHTVGVHDDGSVHDAILVSGGTIDTGITLRGAPFGGPPRWYIMGGLTVSGTMDVSPRTDLGGSTDAMPVTGGAAGGAAGLRAAGASGGYPGTGGAGAGGGGHSVPGEAGEASDGTPMGGGVGGAASSVDELSCLIDPISMGCGGGGGGGATGAGGPGGGGLFLASLEPLDLALATLLARGADGVDGGGGGAGGEIFIAAPSWTTPATMGVEGGHGAAHVGGGRGGDGAPGRLRIDIPGVTVAGAWAGPRVDPTTIPLITDTADLVLNGTALPGTVVHVVRTSDLFARAVASAADGTFTVTFPLVPGTNRLRITEDGPHGEVHGWIGNSFEFGMDTCITHAVCVPKGALVDVAYVPATE